MGKDMGIHIYVEVGGGSRRLQSLRNQSGSPFSKYVYFEMPVTCNSALGYGSQRNPHRWDLQEAIRSSIFVKLHHNLCDLQVDHHWGTRW